MRLLNVYTLKFGEFEFPRTPPYVVASHRWAKGFEVTYRSFCDNPKGDTSGHQKIHGFCSFIKRWVNGVEWLWIDTCCIDSSSSQELQETINSMFEWYSLSILCLAYLSDVQKNAESISEFTKSVWFNRGWTLQELLAPRMVVFLSEDWNVLGHKGHALQDYRFPPGHKFVLDVGTAMERTIETATEIPTQVLKDWGNGHELTLPQRLSWMRKRRTTRPEDMVYCLLGIFRIRMQVDYGEGPVEAWDRMKEAMKKKSEREAEREMKMRSQLQELGLLQHQARVQFLGELAEEGRASTYQERPPSKQHLQVLEKGESIGTPSHDTCIEGYVKMVNIMSEYEVDIKIPLKD